MNKSIIEEGNPSMEVKTLKEGLVVVADALSKSMVSLNTLNTEYAKANEVLETLKIKQREESDKYNELKQTLVDLGTGKAKSVSMLDGELFSIEYSSDNIGFI